jgi:hypothetical protein
MKSSGSRVLGEIGYKSPVSVQHYGIPNGSEYGLKVMSREELPVFLRLRIATPVWDFLDGFSSGMVDEALRMGADVLVFPDRPWMGENIKLPHSDPIKIALLSFSSFSAWWKCHRVAKARNHVRAAIKAGVTVEEVEGVSDQATAKDVVRMYDESPIRENRYFRGYGRWDVSTVQRFFKTDDRSITLLAKCNRRVIGIDMSKFKRDVAILASGITSLKARRKFRGIDHMFLARQIEALGQRGVRYLIYGKCGVLPHLDAFKIENGFRPVEVNYNHLLLTRKAMVLAEFGLHRRPDILMSRHPSILPWLASIQRRLPLSVVSKLHLFV